MHLSIEREDCMRIALLGHTTILPDAMKEESGGRWEPEDNYDDASALSEFAGRQCYESWHKPNPATSSNEGYLDNILRQQHFSVMEHGTATFRISGVSRSLTHELIRHRHASYSQLSQRYVTVDDSAFVIPPLYESEFGQGGMFPTDTEKVLTDVWERAVASYDRLVAIHQPRLIQRGVDTHRARKMAREAARCVLPNMTPTAIVMSGNHRAWRELLENRGTIHADAEIRRMAVEVYRRLADLEPNLYQDFSVTAEYGEEVLIRGRGV